MGAKAGWLAFFVFVWLIGAFLGSTFDGYGMPGSAYAWAGNATADYAGGYAQSPISVLDYISNVTNSFQRVPFMGNISIPVPTNGEYWAAVFKVITWRWSFMEDYDMLYWICFAPFVIVGVLSLISIIYGLIQGNIKWG